VFVNDKRAVVSELSHQTVLVVVIVVVVVVAAVAAAAAAAHQTVSDVGIAINVRIGRTYLQPTN